MHVFYQYNIKPVDIIIIILRIIFTGKYHIHNINYLIVLGETLEGVLDIVSPGLYDNTSSTNSSLLYSPTEWISSSIGYSVVIHSSKKIRDYLQLSILIS